MTADSAVLLLCRALAGSLAIAASVVDWRTFRLPAPLTLCAAIMAIGAEGLFGPGWVPATIGAAAGFAALKLAQVIARYRHKKDCLGSGDAMLMLSLGALTGLKGLPWALGLATGLAFLSAKILHREKLPFGPYLTTGCLVVAVIQWVSLNV